MDSGLYLPTDEVLQFQSFVQQIIDSMKFAFSFFLLGIVLQRVLSLLTSMLDASVLVPILISYYSCSLGLLVMSCTF